MRRTIWTGIALVSAVAATTVVGCQALTRAEASAALEEAGIAAEAQALTSGSVEIGTSFTIGMAVEAAAAELRTFVETQLPCAAVTLEGSTLTIEYGANPGTCTYRGKTYAGSHSITIMRNQMDDVEVVHTWTGLTDGAITVTGDATVTWSASDRTRHVEHELTWTRISDGRTATGSGDRLQRPLEGGLFEGFAEDGTRAWEGESGTWSLTIDGVEMRWVDAVPQAGTYTLTTPELKTLSLAFARADFDTITVTVASGARSYDFDVTTLPAEE